MFSRVVIGGLAGDSGKTLVSLALVLAARERGRDVAAFKKGPDYIDAAWLTWASGRPARNLDTFLMGRDAVAASFERHASADGVNIIEGNRGLHDGIDADGTHSTAALARLLGAPVLLVVSAAKATRTVAALVLGCQTLEPDVEIAGVILNRIGSPRHEAVIREAVASVCDIPVVGSLPRFSPGSLVPGRHLGLVTPSEHAGLDELRAMLIEHVARRLDVDAILAIARGESPLGEQDACPTGHFITRMAGPVRGQPHPSSARKALVTVVGPARRAGRPRPRPPAEGYEVGSNGGPPDGRDLRIGYLKDAAFTFYYPENLEALEAAGATLVPISAVSGGALPADLHALYIGGGFPETHAVALSRNTALLEWIRDRAEADLPIYAECGGLMLLSRVIVWRGTRYPMAGVLPFDTEVCDTPQGHGYVEMVVDAPNPFYPAGLIIRGHAFHYSRPFLVGDPPPTSCSVARGTGCWSNRDGIVVGSVWASYAHVHALGTPAWAAGMIRAARRFAR